MGAAAEPPINEAQLNFLSGWGGQPSFSPIPREVDTYFTRSFFVAFAELTGTVKVEKKYITVFKFCNCWFKAGFD